jgi:hypothetical protein
VNSFVQFRKMLGMYAQCWGINSAVCVGRSVPWHPDCLGPGHRGPTDRLEKLIVAEYSRNCQPCKEPMRFIISDMVRIGKEAVVALLRCYQGICVEGLRNTMTNFSQPVFR